jgi:hypothetical protein
MTVEIEGVTLHLAHPDEVAVQWVGQEELMRQLLAAWMVVNEQDLPMNPRLLGKPGVGKTTLAYAAGKRMGRDVYILQATMDTRPEDLLITPVIEGQGSLRYVASPLVTAMLRGGIAILDEGNRMSEKSWASLAPILWRMSWWWCRSTCSTPCWTPWRDRKPSPWSAPAARASSCSTRTRNRWPGTTSRLASTTWPWPRARWARWW